MKLSALLLAVSAAGYVFAFGTARINPSAYAQPTVTPQPAQVEEAGPVENFLELLKSQEGREALLVKLGELREAAMQLPPPKPGVPDKREEIMHEAAELEMLLQQYQQTAPPKFKKGE